MSSLSTLVWLMLIILFLMGGCSLQSEKDTATNADVLYCLGFCAFLDAQTSLETDTESERETLICKAGDLPENCKPGDK